MPPFRVSAFSIASVPQTAGHPQRWPIPAFCAPVAPLGGPGLDPAQGFASPWPPPPRFWPKEQAACPQGNRFSSSGAGWLPPGRLKVPRGFGSDRSAHLAPCPPSALAVGGSLSRKLGNRGARQSRTSEHPACPTASPWPLPLPRGQDAP